MAEDWAVDVRKYAPNADAGVIAGIVRYCGIALNTRDASLVSFTDPVETARVRDNYCRKKLGLTDPDVEIDAAIARVGERMQGDTTKNRVTVYYLLAEVFGKLGLFAGAAAPAIATPASATSAPAAPSAAVPATSMAAAALPLSAMAATGAAAATDQRQDGRGRPDGMLSTAALVVGGLAVIIIGTAIAGSLVGNRSERAAAPVAAAPAAEEPVAAVVAAAPAPVAVAPAIPDGAGVVAQELEGKPTLSVYFDTAKTDIAPDFGQAAAPVKAWIDSHPGARLAVSGFNDPRGDAAFNAELSKNRAKAVAAALATLGVPAGAIDLVKPPETTDATTSPAQARRVDIVVQEPTAG